MIDSFGEAVVRGGGQCSGMRAKGPGFDPLISAGYLSLLGIITEWPKTTQIVAILSLDGTYNVYMPLRL